MPKIFISYRRDDSDFQSHFICQALRTKFDTESIFMDVDTIPPGVDFRKHLNNAVSQCDVLLAVIGNQWLNARSEDGQRRLDSPRDFVRIEIEAALSRDIPVIPVLMGRVLMPDERDLPPTMSELAYRNAVEVRSGRDFNSDVDRMIRGIIRLLESRQPAASPPAENVPLPSMELGGKDRKPESISGSPEVQPPGKQSEAAPATPLQTRPHSPVAAPGSPTQQVMVDDRTQLAFVLLPPSEFLMGSEKGQDREKPIHKVRLTREFLLSKYTVTNAQYARFLESAGDKTSQPKYWADRKYNQPEQPVVGVSWDEAQAYCRWADCRLPTEAEWEYACRAGTTMEYSFGDDEKLLAEYGWYDANSGSHTQPVGAKKPNDWGLHDMHGNVWEWCQDLFVEKYYASSPVSDPPGPDQGVLRVIRGGSWYSSAESCRSSCRYGNGPWYRDYYLGFRVARSSSVP